MSYADEVFIKTCKDILENGSWDKDRVVRPRWEDGSPAHTIKKFGVVNRYDLRKEFPIMTLRRTYMKSALDELLWIYQKKSNNIHDLNSHVWDQWADETGSIGKAYGYQMGVKHKFPQGEMDQVDLVLWQLKNDPASRRIMTTTYIPADLKDMHLAPCAYSMTFNVTGNTLNAVLNQRSQDMLAASNWNVVQYALLLKMMAHVNGMEAGELVHVIADCHIYERHVPIVEELITRVPRPAPELVLVDKDITDFYQKCRKAPGFRHGDIRHKTKVQFLHYMSHCGIMFSWNIRATTMWCTPANIMWCGVQNTAARSWSMESMSD